DHEPWRPTLNRNRNLNRNLPSAIRIRIKIKIKIKSGGWPHTTMTHRRDQRRDAKTQRRRDAKVRPSAPPRPRVFALNFRPWLLAQPSEFVASRAAVLASVTS